MPNDLETIYERSDADVRPRNIDAGTAARFYKDYTDFVTLTFPPPGTLLDIGCGNGWSSYLFSRCGYQTIGLDLSSAAFETPPSSMLELRAGNAMELPFADSTFDIVAGNQMLEHTSDPERVLQEMLRVVKPGGVLCIVGPNLISPLFPLRGLFRYVWRNRPLRRIVVRDSAMARHPGGNTLPETLIHVVTNCVRIGRRSLSSRIKFELRKPDLVPPFHSDNDACYLCNPIDIARYLRANGCTILRNGKPVRPALMSILATGTWVAARKSSPLAEGHYAKKQIFCKDWLISWSHQRRFKTGLELARSLTETKLLDYGCGDGTFLKLLLGFSKGHVASMVGAEIDDYQVNDCRRRFDRVPNVAFANLNELSGPEHIGCYDAIFCMEVLEHVVNRDRVLDHLESLLTPQGRLFVSVPVETGLVVIIKQTVRRLAAWRGLGDYKWDSKYTFAELWRSVFAGKNQHIERAIYTPDGGAGYHYHKGFNWRVLERELATRFQIERKIASPIAWLGPSLASQVWFVARKLE